MGLVQMVVVQMRVVQLLVGQLGVVQMAPQSNWGQSNQGQSNWGQSKWGQTHILVWKGLPLFGQSPISFETCCFLGVILVPLVICSFAYGGFKNCSEYRNSDKRIYISFMFSFIVGCSCSWSSPSKSASGAAVILFANMCVTHLENYIPSPCLCYGSKTLLTAVFLTNNLQPSEKIVNS